MDYRMEDGRIEVADGYYWRPMRDDERLEVLLQIVVDQDRQLRSLRRRIYDLGG
jgi:hypothetical protein